MVAVVLFAFLLNWRTTAISLTAIPVSILSTAIIFHLMGLSINTMTLGGLAIAIGELVDDAVVDVENIFRRLRENREQGNPRSVFDVVVSASQRGALGHPLRHAHHRAGVRPPVCALRHRRPAVCAARPSLHHLNPGQPRRLRHADPGDGLLHAAEPQTARRARKLARAHPQARQSCPTRASFRPAAPVDVGSPASASSRLPALRHCLPRTFLPPFNEGTLTINMLFNPGISLAESNRVGLIAEKLILGVPEVKAVGRRTGRAELDEHAEGVHSSEIEVDLKEGGRGKNAVIADLRARLAVLPVALNIGQPISHRLDHMLSGVRAQIAIKFFGEDLDTLRALAEDFRRRLSRIEGLTDLQVEKQVRIPQLDIIVDYTRAALYGLQPQAVTEHLERLVQRARGLKACGRHAALRCRDAPRR